MIIGASETRDPLRFCRVYQKSLENNKELNALSLIIDNLLIIYQMQRYERVIFHPGTRFFGRVCLYFPEHFFEVLLESFANLAGVFFKLSKGLFPPLFF